MLVGVSMLLLAAGALAELLGPIGDSGRVRGRSDRRGMFAADRRLRAALGRGARLGGDAAAPAPRLRAAC